MHIVSKEKDAEKKPLSNISVLILGSLNDAQDVVRIILHARGARVLIAASALQAAAVMIEEQVDLIVSSAYDSWGVQFISERPSIPSIGLVTHPYHEFLRTLELGFTASSSVGEPEHILATAERLVREPMLAQ